MDTRIAPPRIDFRLHGDDDESLAMAKAIHDVIEERIPSYVRKSLEPQAKEIAAALTLEMGRRFSKELDTLTASHESNVANLTKSHASQVESLTKSHAAELESLRKEMDDRFAEVSKGMDDGFRRLVDVVKSLSINLPENSIKVNLEHKAADVIVNVPKQEMAPIFQVPQVKAADVVVNVPQMKAPDVNVTTPEVKVLVPEQAAPQVNVTVPPRGPVDKFFQYDEENRPVRIREVEVRE